MEAREPMDEQALQIGLLMEAAQAQQAAIEASLHSWREHLRGLDEVVREALRVALVQELQGVAAAAASARQALQKAARAASVRSAGWAIAVTTSCCAALLMLSASLLPSAQELADLRAQRERLEQDLARLRRQGAGIELRRCGAAQRLCVRVDRTAPAYGERADYFVVPEASGPGS